MALTINFPFRTHFKLLQATYTRVNGVMDRTLEEVGDIFVSQRSYGGTEHVVDGIWTVEDTLTLQTWYRPDIDAGSVLRDDAGGLWEMYTSPENIDGANRFLQFKIRRIKGDG